MNVTELRGKTDDELKAVLLESKKEAFNLRFQQTSGAVEKTSRIREVRKTIARAKTLLNQPQELRAATAKKVKAPAAKTAKKTTEKAEGKKKTASKKTA